MMIVGQTRHVRLERRAFKQSGAGFAHRVAQRADIVFSGATAAFAPHERFGRYAVPSGATFTCPWMPPQSSRLYVGTPAQEQDFEQYRKVRADAVRLGMPLIVWAYPRGSAIEAKGGRDSFYAVDYAARTASELGADIVKVNFPHPEKTAGVQAPYEQSYEPQTAIDAVVRSANRTMLLVSGGSRLGDEAMLAKARMSMDAGATGLIFGRNVWQRERDEALRFVGALRKILDEHPGTP